jgi:hypothetical protein
MKIRKIPCTSRNDSPVDYYNLNSILTNVLNKLKNPKKALFTKTDLFKELGDRAIDFLEFINIYEALSIKTFKPGYLDKQMGYFVQSFFNSNSLFASTNRSEIFNNREVLTKDDFGYVIIYENAKIRF